MSQIFSNTITINSYNKDAVSWEKLSEEIISELNTLFPKQIYETPTVHENEITFDTCVFPTPVEANHLQFAVKKHNAKLTWEIVGEEQMAFDAQRLAEKKRISLDVYEVSEDDYDDDYETVVQYFFVTTVLLENGKSVSYDIVRDYYADDGDILYKDEDGKTQYSEFILE